MKKIAMALLTVFLLGSTVSYARDRDWDKDNKGGESFQDVLDKMAKPALLTPQGKRGWRAQRAQLQAQLIDSTNKAFPAKTLNTRVMQFIKQALYGTDRCYHSDDIGKYVPQGDLKSVEVFTKAQPKESIREIYLTERKKIENKMLANDEIQRKKDLENELHKKYKLFEDRERVTVKDIRGKEYTGIYHRDRTTETLARIGSYSLSRFDIDIESRARIWQREHDQFVKKEVRRITRRNTYLADEQSDDNLDGRIQFMYLEAGYIPDLTQPQQNIFSMNPEYWLSRSELVAAIGNKIKRDHLEKLFKGRGYAVMDIGDGTELVPPAVIKAFNEYLSKVAVERKKWDAKQKAKQSRFNDNDRND